MSRTSTSSSWLASKVVVSTLAGSDPQTGEQLRVRAGDPGRGSLQTVAVRVLTDRDEDFPDRFLDPAEIDGLLDR